MYSNYVNAPSKRAAICSIFAPISIALTCVILTVVYFLVDYAAREEVQHCFITQDEDVFAMYNFTNPRRDWDVDKETKYILFRAQNMSHYPKDVPNYAGRMSSANFDCSRAKGVRDAPGTHREIYGNETLGFVRTYPRQRDAGVNARKFKDCWEKYVKENLLADWNTPSKGDYGSTRVGPSYSWNDTNLKLNEYDNAMVAWNNKTKTWMDEVFDVCFPEGTGAENECCANWEVQTSMFKTFGTLGGLFFLVKIVFDLIYLAVTGGSKIRVNASSLQLENTGSKGMQAKVISVQPSPLVAGPQY